MHYIFYIMGKSSTGKDTIYKHILDMWNDRNIELDLKPIATYTTRPMRAGETEGIEYHFVNGKTYCRMTRNCKVIERRAYNTANGVWTYFTSSESIDLEHSNYIGIGTIESYIQLCEYYGTEIMVPIYIETPGEYERAIRALKRERKSNNDYAEMYRRLAQDLIDFSEENLKAAGICHADRFINDDLESCVNLIFDRIYYTILGSE